MKVANITMHAINNYGSAFQAIATEHLFSQLGCDVETIDFIPENAQANTLWKILTYKGLSPIIRAKKLVRLFTHEKSKRAEIMEEFRQRYLHLTKRKYLTNEDLFQDVPEADIYCTGSDQTWNTINSGEVSPAFFLKFSPDNKRRIAFSASFGISELPEKDKAEVKSLLQRYHSISVREESGLKILKGLGIPGIQVLDPTLAVEPEFWDNLSTPRMFKEDYLLVYQLNRNPIFTKYMKDYAQKNNLKIVHLRSRKDTELNNGVCLTEAKPEEVLSLFKYSRKVLTDSFHATVFSHIFHCDFMVIYPPRFSARLDSMLNLTGLMNRRVTDFNRFDYTDMPIDYRKVDNIIGKERIKTLDFLKQAIS